MIKKIDQYLRESLKKPAYICAMILDPKFKTVFWANNAEFIWENYGITVDDILVTFQKESEKYTSTLTTSNTSEGTPLAPKAKSFFASALYQPAPEVNGIRAEFNQYLKEDIETEGVKVLPYWANRQKTFPLLASMARRFLSIPATSAASERVFSNGRRIVSWQRSALKPVSVEQLICLKDWFKKFDGII